MYRPLRRTVLSLGVALLSLSTTPALAQADYPNKTVRIVVPYAPGGTNDTVARLLALKLGERLGQTVIIENKPGASGNLGATQVARTTPDGYTLLLVTMGHTIHPSLYNNLQYDITRDLAPVASLTTGPALLMVNPDLGINTLQELIDRAKAKPGELNFSSAGNGSSTHLGTEYLSTQAGIKMTHIPFGGSAPAMMDVIAGNSHVVMDMMFSATPQVQAGKLKAIAQTGATRSAAMPDVPTVAESGLPDYTLSVWNGLMAPAGTPAPIIDKLNTEIKAVIESDDFRQRLAAQGYEPDWSTPADFGQRIQDDIARWGEVVRTSGAQVD